MDLDKNLGILSPNQADGLSNGLSPDNEHYLEIVSEFLEDEQNRSLSPIPNTDEARADVREILNGIIEDANKIGSDPNSKTHGGGANVRRLSLPDVFAPVVHTPSDDRSDTTSTSTPFTQFTVKSYHGLKKQKNDTARKYNSILLINTFEVVRTQITYADADALQTFAPIKDIFKEIGHTIYIRLLCSEQHQEGNLMVFIIKNGKPQCYRWQCNSGNYEKSGLYVLSCAGVETNNRGGKRIKGQKNKKDYGRNRCSGSIKIEFVESGIIISQIEPHNRDYCLRNMYEILRMEYRPKACQEKTVKAFEEELTQIYRTLKQTLEKKFNIKDIVINNVFKYKKSEDDQCYRRHRRALKKQKEILQENSQKMENENHEKIPTGKRKRMASTLESGPPMSRVIKGSSVHDRIMQLYTQMHDTIKKRRKFERDPNQMTHGGGARMQFISLADPFSLINPLVEKPQTCIYANSTNHALNDDEAGPSSRVPMGYDRS